MSILTIRLPADKHARLKALAAACGASLSKLFEELSTKALTEFDAETRFRLRAAGGDRQRGLEILEGLDRAYGTVDVIS
jgi:hypothetical protein